MITPLIIQPSMKLSRLQISYSFYLIKKLILTFDCIYTNLISAAYGSKLNLFKCYLSYYQLIINYFGSRHAERYSLTLIIANYQDKSGECIQETIRSSGSSFIC